MPLENNIQTKLEEEGSVAYKFLESECQWTILLIDKDPSMAP